MFGHAAPSIPPPSKRPRLGVALHDHSHQSDDDDDNGDDDDDELNYEPEEVSERRDPMSRLARSRATAAFRLKSTFEHIFEKYEHDFSDIGDEIDLRTGDIVVDNGHIERMQNEKDRGLGPGPGPVSEDVHEAAARPPSEWPRGESSSEGDEEEDRIIRGESTTLTHRGTTGLVQQRTPVISQRSLSAAGLAGRAHQLSSFTSSHQTPFGSTPLHLGSWGPPGALDLNWTAPPLPLPQFKSSFGANLFAKSYQLPAREGSRSIWGPRSGKDDDEDDNETDPLPKPRLRLPPTKRVPPRPVAMKLIRAPRKDPAESDEEDEILMGSSAVSTLPRSPVASVQPQPKGLSIKEPTHHAQTEGHMNQELVALISVPDEQPVFNDDTTGREAGTGKSSDLSPVETVTLSKIVPSKDGSEPNTRHVAAATDPDPVLQSIPPNQLVVELCSTHLSRDPSYLDLTHVTDSALDSYLLPPPPQADSTFINDHLEIAIQDSQDEPVVISDHTIPESQEQPPSSSAPPEPRVNAVEQVTVNSPRISAVEKVAYLEYELSDEEGGFLARPAKKRKRTSTSTHLPTSQGVSHRLSTVLKPERPKESADGHDNGVPLTESNNSTLPAAVFSPIKTRAALKSRSSLQKVTLSGGGSQRLTRGRRRSWRSPSGSGAGSLLASSDEHPEPSLPVHQLSPPPESASEWSGGRMEVDPPMLGVSVAETDNPPQEGDCSSEPEKRRSETKWRRISREAVISGAPEGNIISDGHLESDAPSDDYSILSPDEQPGMSEFRVPGVARTTPSVATKPAPARSEVHEANEEPVLDSEANTAAEQPVLRSEANTATKHSVYGFHERRRKSGVPDGSKHSYVTRAVSRSGDTSTAGHRQGSSIRPRGSPGRASKGVVATPPLVISREVASKLVGPVLATPTKELQLPDTAAQTPKRKAAMSAATPGSIPSTGHRSLISLVPANIDGDSEDELTLTSPAFWSLFNQLSSAQSSTSKRNRRALSASTPSKSERRSREKKLARASVGRLSFGFLDVERPSDSDESVMRTPGGTIRKCGEGGAMCGKDFCFTCC